jgi:hypothetical protein
MERRMARRKNTLLAHPEALLHALVPASANGEQGGVLVWICARTDKNHAQHSMDELVPPEDALASSI